MTIIRVEYQGTRYDLDVLESTPIRLDISAIENNDIGEIFGAASQTFTLPGSKNNNKFFKHAYKVGTEVVPGLNESVTCWVISESDTLLEGSLFLDSVVKTTNGGVNYEVIIVNNVITFNETIKTTRVKDLAWNDYTHSFSMLNVTASWDNELFGGDIFYPLIDQGRDGSETTGSLANVAIGEGVGFINSPSTPLKVNQLTPAVRVKTVLDKVFEAGGFTYETSLIDLFNQTYILPKQTETLAVKGSGFSGFGFIAGNTSDQIIPASTSWTTIQFNSESFDEANAYNTSTYTYNTKLQGTYNFKSVINYAIDPEDTSALLQIRLRNTTDNTTLSSVSFNPTTLTGSFELETGKINVGQFKDLQLQFRYTQGGGTGLLDATVEVGSSFQTLETPINWETGIIQMGEQFDPQVKCIDIIKGISQKFNLVFEPDYTKNKVIKIETYKNWIATGTRKDWTQKIQNAERIFLKSPLSSQPKTLEFQDAKDNDKLSKQVIDNAEGLQWGTAIVDAISDVPQGEKKVGEYFAPVVLEQIPGALTIESSNVYPYIPQLYKTDDTQVERKTFKFKPRIGYKVNGTLPTTCYIGNNITPFQNYATISNYDTLSVVSGSTKNLHWNETFYPPTFNASATGSITAYDEYWSNYVNDLYRDDNKILKADIYFEPYELRDIKLNDAIFVEDSYYRINKISGYNVNNPDVVSVELIGLSSGELPSVDINCNFDFEWGLTTSTTTLIPPVQPTTSTTTAAPLSASVTITNASNETCDNGSLNFAINGGYTPYTLNVNSTFYGGGTNSSWNVLVSNLEDGTYPWTITDNIGTTISGSETIICTYVPPTTTTSTTTTTTVAPYSFGIKTIYSGSTQPFTGSVNLINKYREFSNSTLQQISYGSVTGGLDIEFTTQSLNVQNLYEFFNNISNLVIDTGSDPTQTHYGIFKFWQDETLVETENQLFDSNDIAQASFIPNANQNTPGVDFFAITSSFEWEPIPSKQIEMTLNLEPALFGVVNLASASLYYARGGSVPSRVKLLEATSSLSSGSYTFKTNRPLPPLENYTGAYALEIVLTAATGQTFKFNPSPKNRIIWKRNGSTVETDTFSSTTLYPVVSAGSYASATTNAFSNWGPVSSFATYSVEVNSLTDAVIYYEGFACDYPFANSDLIAASSSLQTGDVVRVGFPNGDACYTILRETTKKEYTFLIEEVFADCATCSGSL